MSEYIPPIQTLLASANPTTRGTARRMKIYFQPSPPPADPDQEATINNDLPVAPAIDSDIDIAMSNKKQYIQYAVDRSIKATANNNNPTPLSPEIGTTAQRTYINQEPELNYSGIPNAFNVFSNSPTMFKNETLTSVEVPPTEQFNTEVGAKKGHYAGNVGRPFAIRKYVGQLNALETSNPDNPAQINAYHNRLVDAQLLKFRGANSQKKRVPPAGGDPETRDNPITLGNMFYQGGLGKFAVGTYVREDTSTATNLTVEQLKQVGLNIVFNAVGGNDIDVNIRTPGDAALAELALAAPIGPRIGQKVKLSRFSAAKEAEKLFGARKINSTTFIDTDDDVNSYGSFNNPFSQFDALVSVGQIAVCVAMVLAFVVTLRGLVAIINLSGDREPDFSTGELVADRFIKGSSTLRRHGADSPINEIYPSQTSDNLASFLGEMTKLNHVFSKPNFNFEDCLSEGIKEFFGFSLSGAGGSFATTSMKIMTESGRLNVILREMIRSGVDLGESAEAAFTGTGASSPITGVVGFIRSLFDLKIIKFINVLVNIGDKVLEGIVASSGGIESLPDQGFLVQKSRLSDGRLAWSTTTAPYYSLMLETLGPIFSPLQSDLNLTPQLPPNSTNQRGNPFNAYDRISAEDVKDIEDSLESDYMPFYFHDLRTNEIMSFHAFLENTSEDFNIEYTSQEGYGRMDKVQIYKGTTRNITVDFKMIATNADSHDDMWYKINRLAMMIYPQWTQGRKLDVGKLRFIQPFSQIPGATPVIRLRLGDIYKSNYSKMAVARLFGATTRTDYNVDNSAEAATRAATNMAANMAAIAADDAASMIAGARATTAGDARLVLLNRRRFTINQASTSSTAADALISADRATSSAAAGAAPTPPPLPPPRRRRGQQPPPLPSARISDVFTANANIANSGNNSTIYLNINTGDFLAQELGRGYLLIGEDPLLDVSFQGSRVLHFGRAKIAFGRAGFFFDPTGQPLSIDRSMLLVRYMGTTSDNRVKVMPLLLDNLNQSRRINIRPRNPLHPYIIRIPINVFNHPDFVNYNYTEANLRREINAAAPAAGPRLPAAAPAADPNQMSPDIFYGPNNPILKAFNSTAGNGLAGVITSFKVDYKESDKRWGIDFNNKLRAPMYVTISVTMAVIHDIPLGLDSNGIMNAPIWPVGNSSNYFMRNERPEPASTPPGPNTVDPPREIRLTADEM